MALFIIYETAPQLFHISIEYALRTNIMVKSLSSSPDPLGEYNENSGIAPPKLVRPNISPRKPLKVSQSPHKCLHCSASC